jgi:hypothetical protein
MAEDYDNADLAVGDSERESLDAHVDACGRRYVVLRKDMRAIRRRAGRTEWAVYAIAVGVLAIAAGDGGEGDLVAVVLGAVSKVLGG